MGFVRQVKERMVRDLSRSYASASNFVLVDFRGLSAREATILRKELRAEGVRLAVVKNAVARFALEKIGNKTLVEALTGMNALVTGDDPVMIAKKLVSFKAVRVKGGLVEGRSVTADEIRELSKLPARKEMTAILVGTIASPIASFLGTLSSVPGTFVRTLAAVAEKLPAAGPDKNRPPEAAREEKPSPETVREDKPKP